MEERELALIMLQPNWVFLFFLQYDRTVYGSHIIGDGWTPLADVASAIPQSIYCLLLYNVYNSREGYQNIQQPFEIHIIPAKALTLWRDFSQQTSYHLWCEH
jgi:hypothetical protein